MVCGSAEKALKFAGLALTPSATKEMESVLPRLKKAREWLEGMVFLYQPPSFASIHASKIQCLNVLYKCKFMETFSMTCAEMGLTSNKKDDRSCFPFAVGGDTERMKSVFEMFVLDRFQMHGKSISKDDGKVINTIDFLMTLKERYPDEFW